MGDTHESFEKETPAREVVMKKTHEELFGSLLFVFGFIVICILLGGAGWIAYSKWVLPSKEERPSIESLGTLVPSTEEQAPEAPSSGQLSFESGSQDPRPVTPVSSPGALSEKTLRVLNGGGTKGSAGKLAESLRVAGLKKVEIGNSVGDYTGTTIYFRPTAEAAAQELSVLVGKTFPKVTILPAGQGPDIQSDLTVIIGKAL